MSISISEPDSAGEDRQILAQTLEQAIDAVVAIDECNCVTLFNAAAERLWGYGRDEVLGRNVSMLVPRMIREVHDDYISANRRTGINRIVGTSREVQVECKNGSLLWASMSISKIRVPGRTWYTAFLKDVSAERQAREQLTQTLEQALDAVVVIDEANLVTFFNAAAERLWGYSRAEVLGRNVSALVPASLQAEHDDLVNANRRGGENKIVGRNREIPIERKDGERAWGLFSLSRVAVGAHVHYTAFIKDITEERQQQQRMRELSLVVNESDNAIIVVGSDACITYVNAGFMQMFGYDLEELRGRLPSEVLAGPHTDPKVLEYIRTRINQPGGYRAEALCYTKAGKPLWVSVVVNPVFDEGGAMVNAVAVLTDITQTKMHEILQHKVLDAMVHELPVLDVMTLACREVERIAPEVICAVIKVEGHGLRVLAGPSLSPALGLQLATRSLPGGEAGCVSALWRDAEVDPLWRVCGELLRAHGFAGCWSSPLEDRDGALLGALVFCYRDASEPDPFHRRLAGVCLHLCALALEREQARAHIHQLAFYDTLTRLPNRAMLRTEASRMLSDVTRTQSTAAVLLINLDRFKLVNDTHGHAAGDDLLRDIAVRLGREVRGRDVVGRVAGDEFVAVLRHCPAGQASGAAERLLDCIARMPRSGGAPAVPYQACASIGVSLFPADGTDIDTLIKHAGMAMRQAKHEGGSRFRFFSDDMNRVVQERAMLEADLRQALRSDGLALHYQPQVSTAQVACVEGVEALLRWQHPTLGNVPPMRFVALAEECGLIVELGRWVLEQGCRQMADWRRRGVGVPRVAINLSASNFMDADLPTFVDTMLDKYSLSPDDLMLEMTESVMMNTDPAVLSIIGAIHARGVPFSMDDFGTGYSSLGYLHRLPISELKLDKSFVQDLAESEPARALTTSVLRIGESLRMKVVAEGVETDIQHRFLAERGCPVVQGYLFAKPLVAADLEHWLSERHGTA